MMQLVKSAAKQVRKDLASSSKKGNKKGRNLARKAASGRAKREGYDAPSSGFAPAAYSMKSSIPLGMSDVRGHRVSWLAGYIYVGNGTLGATDSVYFVDPTKALTVVPLSGYGNGVPIAGADSTVGASYVTDVMKHYARLRINRQLVQLRSLSKNTGNGMVVVIACRRGPADIGQTKSDATAAITYGNLISMAGYKSAGSWEDLDIDATSCIAGGNGAAQNEFDVNDGANAGPLGNQAYFSRGVIPSTFAVSGNNTTTALRGVTTHAVIITQFIDLLDYVGGVTSQSPESVSHKSSLWGSHPGGRPIPVPSFDGRPSDVALGADQKAAPPAPSAPPVLQRQVGYVAVREDDWEVIELSGKRAMRHRVTGELREAGTGEARTKVAPAK